MATTWKLLGEYMEIILTIIIMVILLNIINIVKLNKKLNELKKEYLYNNCNKLFTPDKAIIEKVQTNGDIVIRYHTVEKKR